MQDVVTTQGYLLRATPYGDHARILSIFSRELGRISAICRAPQSKKFSGVLEPFQRLELGLKASKTDLFQLQFASIERAFPSVIGDLPSMRAASHVMALVAGLLPERHQDDEIFDSIDSFLQTLSLPNFRQPNVRGPHFDASDERPPGERQEWLRLIFSFRVLALCGSLPRVDACVRCGRRPSDEQAILADAVLGGAVCRSCGGGASYLSGRARRIIHQSVSLPWSDVLAWLQFSPSETENPLQNPEDLVAIRAFVDEFLVHFGNLRKNDSDRSASSKIFSPRKTTSV